MSSVDPQMTSRPGVNTCKQDTRDERRQPGNDFHPTSYQKKDDFFKEFSQFFIAAKQAYNKIQNASNSGDIK